MSVKAMVFVSDSFSATKEKVEKTTRTLGAKFGIPVAVYDMNDDPENVFGRYGIKYTPMVLLVDDDKVVDKITDFGHFFLLAAKLKEDKE